MFKIPTKVSDRFQRAIPKFKDILLSAKDRDLNESDTVKIIQDILADVFGYDKYMEITSEYAIWKSYCDLAIKMGESVEFLIEVKAIGMNLKENHLKQVVDYGANKGVPWVVLTNGLEWNLYRLRFEKPINYDLVCHFNFTDLSTKNEKDQDILWMFSKEGIKSNSREIYFQQKQAINGFTVAAIIRHETILNVVRRELRKFAPDCKVEIQDIDNILLAEVLKRNVAEGEEADKALAKVKKFYNKSEKAKKQSQEVSAAECKIQNPNSEPVSDAPEN